MERAAPLPMLRVTSAASTTTQPSPFSPLPTPPSIDDALHTVTCPVCHRKQRLGARYCDQCGKRLHLTRIADTSDAPSHPSPTATPTPPSPSPSLSKRLWDRPLPALTSSRLTLRSLSSLHTLLTSLHSVETAYIQAVTKLTCASPPIDSSQQPTLSDATSFFVQHFIDRVRGKWKETKRLERSLAALSDVIKQSELMTARMEKEVNEAHKALQKEAAYLLRQETKHTRRTSQTLASPSSAASSLISPSASTFSRWRISGTNPSPPASEEHKVSTPHPPTPTDPKLAKLHAAQASEWRARAAQQLVVTTALLQLERMEMEKVEVMREVMGGLMLEVSRDHMKAYQSALAVKEKVDAVDSARDTLDWARHIESGTPCTWIVSAAGGEVKSPFGSVLRSLREDGGGNQGSSAGGSGEHTPSPTAPQSPSQSISGGDRAARGVETTVIVPSAPATLRGSSASSTSSPHSHGQSHSNGDTAVALPTQGRQSSASVVRPSPRVMSDSHHQLVIQPSRLLRLESIATPTLSSSSSVGDDLPWLPPHAALVGWHVEPRQWEMASFETLLLTCALQPTATGAAALPQDGTPLAIAVDILREKLHLSPHDLQELADALLTPLRSSSAVSPSSSPSSSRSSSLLSSASYRLLLLRTVPEDAFSSLKAYTGFYQRQCDVILACLLWHTVNLSHTPEPSHPHSNRTHPSPHPPHPHPSSSTPIREWHHNGKVYSTDKMQSKLIERVKALADVYCDTGGGEDYAARRRDRVDALRVVMDEIGQEERGEGGVKRKGEGGGGGGGVLARMMKKKEVKREGEEVWGADAVLLPYPRQLRRLMYRELLAGALVKSTSPMSTPDPSPPPSPSAGGAREVEEKMAVLHPRYASLLSSLSAFAAVHHLPALFTSLCRLAVLLDVVNDQAVVQECAPLATPAMRSSEAVLGRMEEEVQGLLVEEREKEEGAERGEVKEGGDGVSEGGRDEALTHFYERALQHFDSQLCVYLSHYHQASPAVLQRVCTLYSALLRLLHPPSASSTLELERIYLREKKVTRILQRSVTVEYARIRGAFSAGRMEPRHWAALAGEVERLAGREREEFQRALMPLTHTSLDVTLPTLSNLFYADVRAALVDHPSADPFFIGIVPSLTRLDGVLTHLSQHLTDRYLLTSTLPAMGELIAGHTRHFVSLQVTHMQQWVGAHVSNEDWARVDDRLRCSSSIIDTLRLLFTTVDTFFTATTALLPHSLAVVPFFITALNECINHYATSVHASCGVDVAGRPAAQQARAAPPSVLHRARSILAQDETVRPNTAGLSQQPMASLCVRLCNVGLAKERLPALHAHVLEQWEGVRAKLSGEQLAELQRLEAELHLTPPPPSASSVDEQNAAGPFSNAHDHLCQCAQALLSVLASRIVYVDWHTPLLTVLYQPLPSSPAVNFRESGLQELLDGTMVDVFKMIGEGHFPGLCEWVYRYVLQALEWTLVKRERGRGQGLLDVGVIGVGDVEVLEEDWKEMRELFVDDLGEDRMKELGVAYDALVNKLRWRATSNLQAAQSKQATAK